MTPCFSNRVFLTGSPSSTTATPTPTSLASWGSKSNPPPSGTSTTDGTTPRRGSRRARATRTSRTRSENPRSSSPRVKRSVRISIYLEPIYSRRTGDQSADVSCFVLQSSPTTWCSSHPPCAGRLDGTPTCKPRTARFTGSRW